MRIVIIGAGAMGTLFAGFLAKKTNDVTLVVKNNKSEKIIKKNGIKITGFSEIFVPPSKLKITSNCRKINPPDLAIIFTKAYDTAKVMPNIKKMLGRNIFVLTLQNGIGNYETISKFTDKNKIILGVTSESATLVRCGKVIHTGKGETVIGKTNTGISEKIAHIFNKCGIKTNINKKIKSAVWSKLVLNCAVNPVAAISKVKNGQIIKYKNLEEVALESGREAIQVAKAMGIKLLFSDISKKINDICRATSDNTNSMLADILAGRKTEIDFINGAVIKIADKLKVPVPVNKMLYKTVKKLEKHSRKTRAQV